MCYLQQHCNRGAAANASLESCRMIRLLDRNCDEAITFEEFCRFACMLPRNQIENNNVAFCWVDSADFTDGLAFRLNMVCFTDISAVPVPKMLREFPSADTTLLSCNGTWCHILTHTCHPVT